MKKVLLVLLPLLAIGILGGWWYTRGMSTNTTTDTMQRTEQTTQQGETMQPQNITELGIEDVVVGTGEEAQAGSIVTVNYTGTFADGRVFDSSKNEGRDPFTFELGSGVVIEGWDVGVQGMKVGGIRKLSIPSDMAYGPLGAGSIPPNTPIYFDVELLEVK